MHYQKGRQRLNGSVFRRLPGWRGTLTIVLLACAGTVQAQYTNTIVPKIITYHPGRYQLADGVWHAGQLYADGSEHLRVRNPDDKKITEYQPVEVQMFVIADDTFNVVHGVDISARRRVSSAFAQRLYHCGDFTLLDYEGSAVGAMTLVVGAEKQNLLLVQPRVGDAVRVPAARQAFEKAMLPLFGACPELAEKIKAGKVGRQHMKSILLTYSKWQQSTQPGTSN